MPEPASTAPVARYVLVCHGCEYVWEPDLAEDPGELAGHGCLHCGGWTWLGEITEPDTTTNGGDPR